VPGNKKNGVPSIFVFQEKKALKPKQL